MPWIPNVAERVDRALGGPVDGDPLDFWYDNPHRDGEHPELMSGFGGDFDGQPPDAS